MQQDERENVPSPEERRGQDPEQPTATAPDSVDRSVPTADQAGKVGPDAADPPRAADKHEPDDRAAVQSGNADQDPELDADEGADAFETAEEADSGAYTGGPERRDEDHISLDTPD
ncbi:hypothetical protein Leucomu_12955 [Leucobacter muris]|uniref:Sugar ABC transporter ATPase n=1 Tax=Leucobacter muris TaxID=1935379 RepID=A0ABX5QHX9_9MICO|nr:hypothetical protein [Leucobacter muris]QAB18696.1 hypothetical protein Leucomu_12955 [Leucobacter muris]